MSIDSRSLAARLASRVGLAIVGGLVAFCSLVAYRNAWSIGAFLLPWGLVLALAASYVGTRAAAIVDAGRSGAIAFGTGWVVVFLLGFMGRPEGDYLIAADWRGYAMILGGVGAVALGIGRVVSAGAVEHSNRLDK